MSCKLIIKTNAAIEIENVIAYYSGLNISLAQKIEIRLSFKSIALNPESFQFRYYNVRIFWLEKFPYGIYYIFEKQEVFILAFWHKKEDVTNNVYRIL